eukprot:TRINITY_DN20978_c0_g1_i3.p1 TRINITY_DN20978_c0_g1~~TRINITY_DN20978_c0_g1_i3.p1  ORF type:complete len:115 (-),score=30.46 TRINITY_DN20978_c0_g1_i3:61-405(-)
MCIRDRIQRMLQQLPDPWLPQLLQQVLVHVISRGNVLRVLKRECEERGDKLIQQPLESLIGPLLLRRRRRRRVHSLRHQHQCQDLSLIHISEPTRLLSISYAVFCLKKKKKKQI